MKKVRNNRTKDMWTGRWVRIGRGRIIANYWGLKFGCIIPYFCLRYALGYQINRGPAWSFLRKLG